MRRRGVGDIDLEPRRARVHDVGKPKVTAGAVASTLTLALTVRRLPAASVAVTTSGMAPSETVSDSANAPSAPAIACAVAASAAAVTRTPGCVWPESASVWSRTHPVGSAASRASAHGCRRRRPTSGRGSRRTFRRPGRLTDTVCRPSARSHAVEPDRAAGHRARGRDVAAVDPKRVAAEVAGVRDADRDVGRRRRARLRPPAA